MNHAAGLGYDAAGNLTNYSASGQYVYDPENRIQTTAGVTYTYDADGDRVEKSGGTTNTIYWYGAPGIIAESDLSGNLKSEYVFLNGKRVARIDFPANTVHYYLSDHLNSTSMVVSAAGLVEEESDYSPYGRNTKSPVVRIITNSRGRSATANLASTILGRAITLVAGGAGLQPFFYPSEYRWVPLDKSEGVVKGKLFLAMRKHRYVCQRR